MGISVLIIENDLTEQRALETAIEKQLGYSQIIGANNLEAEKIILNNANRFDLIIITATNHSELKLLLLAKNKNPYAAIIALINHQPTIPVYELISAGITDYATKQQLSEKLKITIQNALRINFLDREVQRLRRKAQGDASFDDIIGDSVSLAAAKEKARSAATTSSPVLIQGEEGVGKELFARVIHTNSSRKNQPFVILRGGNPVVAGCASAEDKIAQAREGCLFIDGLETLPMELQIKLAGLIKQAGLKDTKIIASTNPKHFNDVNIDLFTALHTHFLEIAPLKERKDDIDLLITRFIHIFSAIEGKNIGGICQQAAEKLKDYDWPGNVRELQSATHRAIVMCNNEVITQDNFAFPYQHRLSQEKAANNNSAKVNDIKLKTIDGRWKTMHELEGEIINAALSTNNWHISAVARKLNIGRSTLYRKMYELGIRGRSNQQAISSGR